ncbi:MAG: PLP-dependent transferase, partial [Planctomycetales bacterium]|nr:PLP-dependent transferase [Planctomycetales bacterium]
MTQNKRSPQVVAASRLSPRRNTSTAATIAELVDEQLRHFSIDPASEFGVSLARIARHIYDTQSDLDTLWDTTIRTVATIDHADRVARFNAQKFLSFQLAKLLDNLQNSTRKSYQSLGYGQQTVSAKGPYAVIDNITAIFSATPVIARTATYIYACAEWIADAFNGKELLLEIYSRLLNPTSISLANHVVDLEAGPFAGDYLAWNFNSGMAAIDAVLSHLLGHNDVLITNRNLYGGAYQLIHDWFAKPSNLQIAVETFDGYDAAAFAACADAAQRKY